MSAVPDGLLDGGFVDREVRLARVETLRAAVAALSRSGANTAVLARLRRSTSRPGGEGHAVEVGPAGVPPLRRREKPKLFVIQHLFFAPVSAPGFNAPITGTVCRNMRQLLSGT